MSLIASMAGAHNAYLVLLAAVVCVMGVAVAIRLLLRARAAHGGARFSWLFMMGVAGGASIWCTHFIAMIAYQPGVPVSYDPVTTALSAMIAMAGCFLAGGIAVEQRLPLSWEVGGLVFGASVSLMHFIGMSGYVMDGGQHVMVFSAGYVAMALSLALLLGLAGFSLLKKGASRRNFLAVNSLLTLSIVGLHFTGMAAMHDVVLCLSGFVDHTSGLGLAFAAGGMALLILGTGLASSFLDSSVRKETSDRVREIINHDALTGLPNRDWFVREGVSLVSDGVNDMRLAAVVINIDRFRDINNILGHAEGDRVLRTIANRFKSALMPTEIVARTRGDEFAVMRAVFDDMDVPMLIKRLQSAIAMRLETPDGGLEVTARFGVAIFPDDAHDIEALLDNADLAMSRVKNLHNTDVGYYQADLDELARQRRTMVVELSRAIESDQFELHYQVQKHVQTHEVVGYEALVRWRHPERGMVSPMEFIPLAEHSGLIVPLGEHVLRLACRQAAAWPRPYKVAVNVSPVQMLDDSLPRLIEQVLDETGLDPSRLEVEITESTLVADPEHTVRILKAVRSLGVSVALDDFGTGYSTLASLSLFPFDRIKLDKAFLSEIDRSPQAKAIVQAVLTIGKSLNIPVLAEGVEREDQMELLREEGCSEAQGYLLGRPAPTITIPDVVVPLRLIDRASA
ncbi:hypothetical protein XM25_12510 [Devosia sp. H5989]|nr:hypothetical protein XM25_12510 [Devosia sp. H5989]